MTEFIASNIVAVIASCLSILWTALLGYVASQVKSQKAMQHGLKSVLSGQIRMMYKEHLHADSISEDDYDLVTSIYTDYKNLGGNGKIAKMYDFLESLRIVDDDSDVSHREVKAKSEKKGKKNAKVDPLRV